MKNKELEYLRYISENDSDGLNRLYSDFLPSVHRLITSNGGSPEDALDIFQDAVIIIYEKIRKGNFTLKSKFHTLLYGICRNLWGNRLQKKSSSEVTLTDKAKYIEDESWVDFMEEQEKFRIFWDSFRHLGQDCQKLLTFFFDGMKMQEIQKYMKYKSVGYTKKRKFQCKEKLIEFIRKDARYIEIMNIS